MSTRVLLNFLVEEGLNQSSVLDLGCGVGWLGVETLRNGATSCVGVDISPEMVRMASELALSSGFGGQAKFQIGDAARVSLPASNVVVMDKVICCYPEMEALLKNASGASLGLFGFIVPRYEGLFKAPWRVAVFFVNLVERFRKNKAPMYLHSLNSIDRILRSAGFERIRRQPSRIWLVSLYRRTRAQQEH